MITETTCALFILRWRFLLFILMLCAGCSTSDETGKASNTLFEKLPGEKTGITFVNDLLLKEDFDVFRYRNYYNGAGVGIGDFNNDSLADVYLTSNMGDNKLYLNKGNWEFDDITERAGVKGSKVWSTGVSIADINGDGFLDIYVCNAGDVKGGKRENELFINNGDLTFTERAQEYGLADRGFSTHAAFFDFDKDGDLDCYVLNNSYRPVSTLGYRNLRNERDEFGGHKLYRNDNNKFVDISEQAGIYGSVIGFGLGVTVGDVNQDSWPDLYVSNDFYERDYLYINKRDGTFSEELEQHLGHISMFSMGADLGDLNNDGFPEIFSTDMLPQGDYRLKTLISFESYDVSQLRLKNGYYHQFMRNMLHLNNQDGTFSEIGEMAGVSATDWSWGALMVDFDNDRYKDILVCNGIYKDIMNQDFVEYLGSSEQMRSAIEGKKIDFKLFIEKMPSEPLSNYVFSRKNDLQYNNMATAWGLDAKGFSNGAAYGDLDNDGDLDLIISNVNQEASVYKNKSREMNRNNFLAIQLKGKDKNTFALGAEVRAFNGNEVQLYDHMPIRGFQSSMDYKIVMGLGNNTQVDSLVVKWPDETVQILKNVQSNQLITLSNADAKKIARQEKRINSLLIPIKSDSIAHVENDYNDFDRDRLQYHMLSTLGPGFAKADLNNDKLDDFFIGGSIGNAARIYLQKPGNKFTSLSIESFEADSVSEDVAATFFDADGDRDLDLYVVTGGSEYTTQFAQTRDKLFINTGSKNGSPVFQRSTNKMPAINRSGSCVKPADIDNDGDLDLFVGTRVIPGDYGVPCDQVLLMNDGKGNFTDVTASIAPELRRLGMVTDACWFDYDKNGFKDLLITGEWMPLTLFLNDGKKLTRAQKIPGLEKTDGWWNDIHEFDADHDGDQDFVVGNLGLNSKFKPTAELPLKVYVNDFDQNGSTEPIFTFTANGIEKPYALRQDLIKQINGLKKTFVYYKDYADKSVSEIFDQTLLDQSVKLLFYEPQTSLLINNGAAGFELRHLPLQAQTSPVFATATLDIDGDNDEDIIMGGNLFAVRPEVGRYDAMHALILQNDGHGNFTAVSSLQSGLSIDGEVRHIDALKNGNQNMITFVRNNNTMLFYQIRK
jgi:hypothetical protein